MNKTDFFVQTYGVDALEQTFKNLSEFKDKKRILMSAFRKATKPTENLMRSRTPVGKTQNLRNSIGTVPVPGEIGVFVGARIKRGYKGFIGHIVDHGTKGQGSDARHYITKKGNRHNTGAVKGKFFIEYSAQETEKQAMYTVADEWHRAIARHIINHDR